MAKTFKIAKSSINSGINILGEKSKITEGLFWSMIEDKVKLITKNEPEQFEEVHERAKNAVKNHSLTIKDTWFEISGK